MGRGSQRNHFFEFLKFKGIDSEEKPEMILCLNDSESHIVKMYT